jgi:hypothetical protein
MSSSSGSSQQPSSYAPPTSQSSGNKQTKGKKKIIIESDGSIVGENCHKWNSRVGDLVRIYIPIDFLDWRRVPQNFKDDVWNTLMVNNCLICEF